MSLPQIDIDYLLRIGNSYEISSDANMTCVVIRGYKLPSGYDRERADLLIRLSPGYPDVPADMWWFNPAVHPVNAGMVPATEVTELFFGLPWQRWSRHLVAGQWISGIDCLESYLALLRRELERYVLQSIK
jgi:hypothetical protein